MASSLPVAAVISENRTPQNHLTYSKREGGGNLYFESFDITSPKVKFFIERSSNNNNRMVMVHLRCFHNNRYLVRESETSHWINADANEVEEDTSRWSCTLFAVENLTPGDPNLPLWTTTRLRFRHVQSGAFLYGYLHQGIHTSICTLSGLKINK